MNRVQTLLSLQLFIITVYGLGERARLMQEVLYSIFSGAHSAPASHGNQRHHN